MQYPIVLVVKEYCGRDPKKLAKWHQKRSTAKRIQSYLNDALAPLGEGTVSEFDYWEIANDTGIHKEAVKRILFANGGGSNGITLRR